MIRKITERVKDYWKACNTFANKNLKLSEMLTSGISGGVLSVCALYIAYKEYKRNIVQVSNVIILE